MGLGRWLKVLSYGHVRTHKEGHSRRYKTNEKVDMKETKYSIAFEAHEKAWTENS